MGLSGWLDKKTKGLRWFDIEALGWGCLIFGAILAKEFPVLMSFNRWWYIGAVVILIGFFKIRFLTRK